MDSSATAPAAESSRLFHLGHLLSVTTGRLVTLNGIGGVYDILNYMTGQSLFTHQLPRACEACGPALLNQHPQLGAVDATKFKNEAWKPWLDEQVRLFGRKLRVTPLRPGAYAPRNPITEAVSRFGRDKVLVVKT